MGENGICKNRPDSAVPLIFDLPNQSIEGITLVETNIIELY